MNAKTVILSTYFMVLLGFACQTLAQEQKIVQEEKKLKQEIDKEEKRIKEKWDEQKGVIKKDWNDTLESQDQQMVQEEDIEDLEF